MSKFIETVHDRINVYNLGNTNLREDIHLRKNVTVVARMLENGSVIPIEIVWEDGRRFSIDRIIDKRKASSTKGGGMGIRYTVRIGNVQKYLFLDDYVWFVEL